MGKDRYQEARAAADRIAAEHAEDESLGEILPQHVQRLEEAFEMLGINAEADAVPASGVIFCSMNVAGNAAVLARSKKGDLMVRRRFAASGTRRVSA